MNWESLLTWITQPIIYLVLYWWMTGVVLTLIIFFFWVIFNLDCVWLGLWNVCCLARDIQAWEYVPLGPFLGKSFGEDLVFKFDTLSTLVGVFEQRTSLNVVLLCGRDYGISLDCYLRCAWTFQLSSSQAGWYLVSQFVLSLILWSKSCLLQDPPPLPYLAEKESVNYDISLEVVSDSNCYQQLQLMFGLNRSKHDPFFLFFSLIGSTQTFWQRWIFCNNKEQLPKLVSSFFNFIISISQIIHCD